MSDSSPSAVAIVGMSGRFPGADNVEAFWDMLLAEREGITRFSDAELLAAGVSPAALESPSYVKAMPVLRDIDRFDAAFFGIGPREAALMDPQHRLFLEEAWHALEDAGWDGDADVGVFAGVSLSTYMLNNLMSRGQGEYGVDALQLVLGNDKDYLATRIAYRLGLGGPAITVQTACSTSLVAVALACDSLLTYQCDMALAGGVSIKLPAVSGYRYEPGSILSPDGHCRTFDARAGGTLFGSGVGVVALKRLSDALANGDHIHAVIRGWATNNDGDRKVGFAAPSVDGQTRVIARALAMSGVSADTIGYVEAHGTATPGWRPDRSPVAEPGLWQRAPHRALPDRIGEDECRPSGMRRGGHRPDQGRAGGGARNHPGKPALRDAQPGDRLRRQPVPGRRADQSLA